MGFLLSSPIMILLLVYLISYFGSVVTSNSGCKEKIAVIGAGPGGLSFSYHYQKFTNHSDADITIFERSDYVGGRSTTVNVYNNPDYPVELGASVYVSANKILVNAVEEFNLNNGSQAPDNKNINSDTLGIYNGNEIFFNADTSSSLFPVQLGMRYGLAPLQVSSLTSKVVGNFVEVFYYTGFPFSLNSGVQQAGLLPFVNATGQQSLKANGISDKYANEFVASLTRVNYAQNLDQIHGLETLVSVAADSTIQVVDGNWQIFEAFVKSAQADLRLNTAVTSLRKTRDNKWLVKSCGPRGTRVESYDKVIIAAPYYQANIQGLNYKVPNVNYVNLHVTLFAVKSKLNGNYFNFKGEVPSTVLTAKTANKDIPFFSISYQRYINKTGDYVYKVFSPTKPSKNFLLLLVDRGSQLTWIHRKLWQSYPYLSPIDNFIDFKLDDNLYYLNTMETFISTMETSALAGANVAAILAAGKNTTSISLPL